MAAIAQLNSVENLTQWEQLRARLGTILGRLVFCGLLLLIVWTTIPYGTVEDWWDAVFEAAVFSLCVVWICARLLHGTWAIKWWTIILPLGLLTGYAFLQTVKLPLFLSPAADGQLVQRTLSIDPYQTYITALKTLALVSFFSLLLIQTSSPRRLKWLVRVVVALGVASAIFALVRQLVQSPESPNGFVLPYLFYGYGYGLFLSPNLFGYQAEMCLGVILGIAIGGGVARSQVPLYVALGLIVWSALVLSGSRGAILGFVCELIMVIIVSLRWYVARKHSFADESRLISLASSRFAQISALLLILMVVAAGVLWMSDEKLAVKLSGAHASSSDTIQAGTTRAEIWRSTYALVRRHPITGVGFGAYYLAIPQYQQGSGRLKVEEAHNDYFDLAASGGVVAVVLSAWFIVAFVRKARLAWQSKDSYRKATCLGAAAALTAAAAHSAADFGLQITGIGVYFLAIMVLAIATVRSRSKRRVPTLVSSSS